jgi:hypothetical protein
VRVFTVGHVPRLLSPLRMQEDCSGHLAIVCIIGGSPPHRKQR